MSRYQFKNRNRQLRSRQDVLLHRPFAAEQAGYKSPTEDCHRIIHTWGITVLCVFDGHGGQAISDTVNRILPSRIYERVKCSDTEPDKIAQILQEEFVKMNSELFALFVGCTGTVSVVTPSHIITNHIGDSPAILFSKTGILLQTTEDHNFQNTGEIERMRLAGNPFINEYLASSLSVSRSFGDNGHLGVIAKGQISIWKRQKNVYLALFSDSFAEALKEEPYRRIGAFLSRQDIVNELMTSIKATDTVKEAVQRAVTTRVEKFNIGGKYCGDNTTLILFFL